MTTESGIAEYTQPSATAVKDDLKAYEGPGREYVDLPPNLASNTDLVKAFHDFAYQYFETARDQAERTELDDNLKSADAMFRLSKNRVQTVKGAEKKDTDTLSNDASSQYHKSIRLISNVQKSIIFQNDNELPARYEPLPDSEDYLPEEGQRIADGRTRYLARVWSDNEWTDFIKKSLTRTNKNAIEFFDVEWEYRTETKREKVPGYYIGEDPVEFKNGDTIDPNAMNGRDEPVIEMYDENSRPTSYVFVDKTRIVKNCPILEFPKARNVWIDLTIDDIQKQTCTTIEFFPSFDDLLNGARDGIYENVEQIGTNHLFETERSDVKKKVGDNKDYPETEQKNGLYAGFKVHCKAPIVDWDDSKKAKLDKGAIPQLFEAVFIGKYGEFNASTVESADKDKDKKNITCSCLLLRKLPYNHGRFTLHKVHSHDDNDGAIHMGYQTLLECNVEEQTITLRQHIDNKTANIKGLWIGEKGNVLTRDLTFSNNKIAWVQPGTGQTALTRLKIPDMTGTTIPFIEWLQGDADELLGTTDAVRGAFAGSRTTGTEYLGAIDQAMKPAIEDAKFIAGQYFVPILRDVADLCDQFAPHWDLGNGLYSDELYGKTRTKIVSVDHYVADLTAKQVLVNFIESGGYDKARADGAIGENGKQAFWRMTGKFLKMPDSEKIFDGAKRYIEAENQAWADVRAIIADPVTAMENVEQLPKPEEMHDVHNRILAQIQLKLEIQKPTRPAEEQDLIGQQISALKYYQALHTQFKEEAEVMAKEQQAAIQNSAPNQSAQPPGMNGEAAGDTLAGVQGAQTA